MLAKISPLHLPARVGKYVIDGQYSQGGMSRLLLGIDDSTHKKAIIKILLPSFASDKDLVDRFINEGRILSMSFHRNIVQLYDYGYFSGGPYIAMEFISGTSLSTILKIKQTMGLDKLKIFLEICQGVRHLHGHGVVHGDLKPDNILITNTNEVKIIDFGIAKVTEEEEIFEGVKAHQFLGSPFYMAPEVQRDYKKISVISDIYSLGVVGYELITGKFSKGKIDPRMLPEQLGEIIERALQTDPQERYQTVDDLISDISSYNTLHTGVLEGKNFEYYFSKYSQLQADHEELLQSLIPSHNSRIGISYHSTSLGDGLYFRCVDIEAMQLVLIAKSVKNKTDGIPDLFRLHEGCEKVFSSLELQIEDTIEGVSSNEKERRVLDLLPEVSTLFDSLARQGTDFAYSLCIVYSRPRRVQWMGCGFGTFFIVQNGGVSPIGLANQTFQQKLQEDDRCIIVGYPFHTESLVSFVKDSILKAISKSPKEVSDYVLDSLIMKDPHFLETHPACLVSIFPE